MLVLHLKPKTDIKLAGIGTIKLREITNMGRLVVVCDLPRAVQIERSDTVSPPKPFTLEDKLAMLRALAGDDFVITPVTSRP